MTSTENSGISRESKGKLLMLRTLWFMNTEGDYPTATKLARESDPRDSVPRGTLSFRRTMIREMRDAGLIELMPESLDTTEHLIITTKGIDTIQQIDREVRQ